MTNSEHYLFLARILITSLVIVGCFDIVRFVFKQWKNRQRIVTIDGVIYKNYVTIHDALESDDITLLHEIIKAGEYINAVDAGGNTPLIYSCICESSDEIVKVLITAGADINAKNKKGETALDIAQAKKLYSIVNILNA